MPSSESEDRSNPYNETTEKSQADILKDKKARLRREIRELEKLNFQIESTLNICTFGDIKHLLTYPESVADSSLQNIPDVETKYANELYQLTGMYCSRIGENDCVFNFGHTYAVLITNTSEEPTVSKWVMPMSVHMDSILLETPLENARDLKPFLANCRHYVDCYTNRVEQYNELKSVVDDISGCFLDSTMTYTKIILKCHDMQDVESAELHKIILSLIYKSDRVRPHKMIIDSMGSERLANATVDRFQTFFKSFKSLDLKKALEKIRAAENTPIIWKRMEDQDELNSNDSSASSSVMNFATPKRKRKTRSTMPKSKRKATEASLPSDSLPNVEQNFDDSNSEELDNPDETLVKSADKRRKKPVMKKGQQQASKKKGMKKAPDVSKKKSKASKSRKRSDAEPDANASKRNLRQSTLEFQSERPKDVEEVPLSKRILQFPGTSGISTTKPKAKSNVTVLENREFGTSTPVSHLNPSKRRFAADNTNVSPIRSKNNTVLN